MIRPRVVGLDLSLTATGVAFSDGSVGTIKTRLSERDRRLTDIRGAIAVAVGGPELMESPTAVPAALVVIEDLPTHAKSAGITGMVHGVVRELLASARVPYALVPPATLKKYATGAGNADKTAMAVAAFKRDGREFADDNQCDAWWLRAMGLDQLGHPVIELPKAQRDALAKVAWPEAAG
ncbi:Holliday junction endonuclease [Microtetraspora niveoalba]|uniref:Holliday junction endonuclease n=1 Tax=Microtetraspora niveoalba TaxID=46175 RepID=UPI00082C57B9|nr:Holliday junction endonuclease [Microtetraspora niveoalba]